MLVSFCLYLSADGIPALFFMHDDSLAYQSDSISVTFTSESQFNYLFT